MKKRLIAICLMATFCLLLAHTAAAASKPSFSTQSAPKMGLVASVLAQTEAEEPEEARSTWDRVWPVLIAVGSFFLFRYMRSRQNDEY